MKIDYMDINSPEGTKIIFTANGGYDLQIDNAKNILSLNSVYTVQYIDIRDWCSYVTLKEFPDKIFNTALFEKVK